MSNCQIYFPIFSDITHTILKTFSQCGLRTQHNQNRKFIHKKLFMRIVVRYKFGYKLKLTNHIDEICKEASLKLNVLARLASYMSISKRRTLINAFFKSQFNYCLLIWMCCNRVDL